MLCAYYVLILFRSADTRLFVRPGKCAAAKAVPNINQTVHTASQPTISGSQRSFACYPIYLYVHVFRYLLIVLVVHHQVHSNLDCLANIRCNSRFRNIVAAGIPQLDRIEINFSPQWQSR